MAQGVGGATLNGVVKEGFSEEVTRELRPEGQEGANCGEGVGKRIPGSGTAYAKSLPREGLNKPRVFEERQRGLSGWKGVNRGGRVGGRAEQEKRAQARPQGHREEMQIDSKLMETTAGF